MAVYTFSTKDKRPEDTEMVERLKTKCEDTGAVFSSLVLAALRKYEHDERSAKIHVH